MFFKNIEHYQKRALSENRRRLERDIAADEENQCLHSRLADSVTRSFLNFMFSPFRDFTVEFYKF
jgi:hypothetical protein